MLRSRKKTLVHGIKFNEPAQIFPSGKTYVKINRIDYYRVNHEVTPKADSNVSNPYLHQVSLSSRSFAVAPLGPILEDGAVVVTYR